MRTISKLLPDNSPTDQLVVRQVESWSTQGLDDSQTNQFADGKC